MSSTSKTYTINVPSGPVELPASVSPDGKFEGIDGRAIHGRIKSATNYTLWAARSIRRLKLQETKDYSRHSGIGPNGGATAEYLFSPESARSILATSRSQSSSDKALPIASSPLDQEPLEEKLKETLPLLQILFGDRTVLSVDARKLHAALNVRKRYTDWIKSQLDRGTWVEGQDYVVFQIQGENPLGGRPSSEYSLSMDMAKHITLMSHCRLGHAVRQYFLRVEEAYHDAREKQLEEIQSALAVRDKKFAEVQAENETLNADSGAIRPPIPLQSGPPVPEETGPVIPL